MKERILQTIRDWTLNHFFITFIILVIINAFFLTNNSIPGLLKIIAFLLLVVYILLFIIARIKINVTKLMHHELKFSQIITAYVVSVIFIILLFSIMYWAMTLVGAGHLKYGSCIGNAEFSKEDILQDPLLVTDPAHYSYFSAMTFFSVGYGDICPMGMNKLIATINAIIGNAFTVLILAMAITNYSSNKDNERKRK